MIPARLFFLSMTFVASMLTVIPYANAEEALSPEEIGWMQRALAPTYISKIQTLRVFTEWCLHELKKPEPDLRPCQLAEDAKEKSTVRDDGAMIKQAIAEMEAAPQSPIIREHIESLRASLREIEDALRPLSE